MRRYRLARLDRSGLGDRLGLGLRRHGLPRAGAAGVSVAAHLDGRPLTTPASRSRSTVAACQSELVDDLAVLGPRAIRQAVRRPSMSMV